VAVRPVLTCASASPRYRLSRFIRAAYRVFS
jgi:hypothetical protein